MVEPMTLEEAERVVREVVADARRRYPHGRDRVAPPIDAARLRELCTGPICEGFEDDIERMRRELDPPEPRE